MASASRPRTNDSPAAQRMAAFDSGDSTRVYLTSLSQWPLLTAAEEVDLAKAIEAGLYAQELLDTRPGLHAKYRAELELVAAEGVRAKERMLNSNLRLVVSVAKRYTGRGLDFTDLIQHGNLGLIRAVEKFDYTKGYKFSTYAMWWLRQAITRGIMEEGRTIRLPVHVAEDLRKLAKAEEDLYDRLSREPTPEELAVKLDWDVKKVKEYLKLRYPPVSLDAPMSDESGEPFGAVVEDADAISPERAAELRDDFDLLDHWLDNLSPRSAHVMRMRFGLYDGHAYTLDEIGRELGLTRERIRQIEKQELDKLRSFALPKEPRRRVA